MCYAIPAKVTELKNKVAIVDYFGEHKNVLNEFADLKIGDYVFAQGGIIIDKIPKKEAQEILTLWQDKFFDLKKIDKTVSQSSKNELAILQKINLKKELTKKELTCLFKLKDRRELKLLYRTANSIRRENHGNACCVHGILEFSNHCDKNCLYCGIRCATKIERYRMTVPEIIKAAKFAVKELGFKALVLQSGEDSWYDDKKLETIVRTLRKMNILVFLSIGVRSKQTYKKLFKAGARGVLMRFETSNRKLFEKMRPGTTLEKRLSLIKFLKRTGYLIATGFLIGLPDETEQDVINNIFLTKSLAPDMYSFGPLIPAKGTPLENQKIIDETTILKIIALTRLLDRNSNILVTSAMETLNPDAKKNGLMAGANSLMINATPENYKKLYKLYPRKSNKNLKANIKETISLLYSLGRAPADLGITTIK